MDVTHSGKVVCFPLSTLHLTWKVGLGPRGHTPHELGYTPHLLSGDDALDPELWHFDQGLLIGGGGGGGGGGGCWIGRRGSVTILLCT